MKFYHVGNDAPELRPGQNVDWSYEPSVGPFMSLNARDVVVAAKGTLSQTLALACFACGEGCRQMGTLHAGDLSGKPGSAKGRRERTVLLGELIQPPGGGGGFKPIMQLNGPCRYQ